MIPIKVDFTPDSDTADEIAVEWTTDGGCGELLLPARQFFPAKTGVPLVAEQSMRASGGPGTVRCKITDDVSSVTKEFHFA